MSAAGTVSGVTVAYCTGQPAETVTVSTALGGAPVPVYLSTVIPSAGRILNVGGVPGGVSRSNVNSPTVSTGRMSIARITVVPLPPPRSSIFISSDPRPPPRPATSSV